MTRCSTCNTPQHLFYQNKCPRCENSPKDLLGRAPLLWWACRKYANTTSDPRFFERFMTYNRGLSYAIRSKEDEAILKRIELFNEEP